MSKLILLWKWFFKLPIYRNDILRYTLYHDHGFGICNAIYQALRICELEDSSYDTDGHFSAAILFPLLNRKDAIPFNNGYFNNGYWFPLGEWKARKRYIRWLIDQYKDDKTDLRTLQIKINNTMIDTIRLILKRILHLPVYRKDVLRYALHEHHDITHSWGLCYAINDALDTAGLGSWIKRSIRDFIPLFRQDIAIRSFNARDSIYWWPRGGWEGDRESFLCWLIEQYKDDRQDLRKI